MQQHDGLLAAFQLDEQTALDAQSIQRANLSSAPTWLHFDRTRPKAESWLREHSGLDAPIKQALLASATRPRLTRYGHGILLMLRGSNEAPGAERDDLMSLRIWAEPERVISLQGVTLEAADPVIAALGNGQGPRTTGDLLTALLENVMQSLLPLVEAVVQQTDELEDRVLDPQRTAVVWN